MKGYKAVYRVIFRPSPLPSGLGQHYANSDWKELRLEYSTKEWSGPVLQYKVLLLSPLDQQPAGTGLLFLLKPTYENKNTIKVHS